MPTLSGEHRAEYLGSVVRSVRAHKRNLRNLRHAAAVVLVGWSLIMPPLSQDRQLVEKNAPFARWDTIGTYDTAAACSHELDKLTAVLAGNISYSVIQRRVLAGRGIAPDDPPIHSDKFEADYARAARACGRRPDQGGGEEIRMREP